jgi:MbtH protein
MSYDDDDAIFDVLTNHEGQYSLWPDGLSLPSGWEPAGFRGPKHACCVYVDEVWTDLRPRSLRDRPLRRAPTRTAGP